VIAYQMEELENQGLIPGKGTQNGVSYPVETGNKVTRS
jgi:hypothetical protein